MKTGILSTVAAVAALALLCPAAATAQPYGPPPSQPGGPQGPPAGPPPQGPGQAGPQGGYYGAQPAHRGPVRMRGRVHWGGSFGIGGMRSEDGIRCDGCTNPIAGGMNFFAGAMLSRNLAIVGELGGTGQTLDADGFETLIQLHLLVAAKFWITPNFWLKGGIGGAALTISDAYGDSFDQGSGVVGLASAGVELIQGPVFSMDLELRLTNSTYRLVDDSRDSIQSAIFGLGLSFF